MPTPPNPTPRTPTPDADSAARALGRAIATMARLTPGGDADTDASGILRVVIPIPIPGMSGLFIAQPTVDRERLRVMAEAYVERGKPWSIHAVGAVPDAVVAMADELGFVGRTETVSVVPLAGARVDPDPVEEYRRVESDEDRATWVDICDTVFGLPTGTSAVLLSREAVAEPSIRAYLAVRDGVAVATAVSVLDPGGWLGLYSVATAVHAQRLGVGGRLVRFLLADGAARGAHTAYLQASDQGRALYERIGFRDAEDDLVVFTQRRPRPPGSVSAAAPTEPQ